MRLSTIAWQGLGRAAAADGAQWVVLDADDVGDLVSRPGWRQATAEALRDPARPRVSRPVLRTPIPHPSKILCCGLNYKDHIAETGRETPAYPTLFAKFADTLTDPDAEITMLGSQKVDWEAELAVVVGAETFRANRAQAAEAILGYTAANDMSARDWQARTLQWLPGKAFDASCPIGPVIVTADAFDPKAGARIQAWVGDEVMQDSNTRELLFDASDLVSYASTFTRLHPGDLILTGTPSGVGLGRTPQRFLADGELVTVTIDGIGSLTNRIRTGANEDA
jgi:2-keto-4-pentenoate hydratase/2-oxohepta-3-ene-1,7-dioic acid hydratase in catechol pathway